MSLCVSNQFVCIEFIEYNASKQREKPNGHIDDPQHG